MDNKTLYNPELNVEFYHITKNGMTAIIKSLPLDWCERDELPEDRKIFSVIRNPVSRFLSSFIEIHKLYRLNVREHTYRVLPKELEDRIFKNTNLIEAFELYLVEVENNSFFDNHNTTQHDHLEGYTVKGLFDRERHLEDVTDFLIFEDMDNEISKMVGKEIRIARHNVGNDEIKKVLKPILNNYANRIKLIYKQDQEIYEKALNDEVD